MVVAMSDCPTAKKINGWIWERNTALSDELRDAGGFRGLFDRPSSEWKDCDIPTKIELLRRMWAFGFPPDEVRKAAAEVIEAHGYEPSEARYSVLEACAELFDHLMRGERPPAGAHNPGAAGSTPAPATIQARDLFERYFASDRVAGVNPHMGDGVWMTEEDAQKLRALLREASGEPPAGGDHA
jgi:hypothetical protein